MQLHKHVHTHSSFSGASNRPVPCSATVPVAEEDADKASVISADSDSGLVASSRRHPTSVAQFLMGVFGRYASVGGSGKQSADTVPFSRAKSDHQPAPHGVNKTTKTNSSYFHSTGTKDWTADEKDSFSREASFRGVNDKNNGYQPYTGDDHTHLDSSFSGMNLLRAGSVACVQSPIKDAQLLHASNRQVSFSK